MFRRWLGKRATPVASQLTLIERDGSGRRVILETPDLIEAPTWTPDGLWLVYNGGGKLRRIRADGSGQAEVINTGDVSGVTNDHLVSPDGATVYFTANARIYAAPLQGGQARLVPARHPAGREPGCFLHGVSQDGRTLSFVSVVFDKRKTEQTLCTLDVGSGAVRSYPLDLKAVDGPEISPDGLWIYFNAEPKGSATGHAQIFRMRTDGSQVEQLTFDARVNWFPHVSPDGQSLMHLSYAEGTQGHPANLPVILRSLPASGGSPVDVVALQGGQGTTNANGWSPDGRRFAYMAYAPQA